MNNSIRWIIHRLRKKMMTQNYVKVTVTGNDFCFYYK